MAGVARTSRGFSILAGSQSLAGLGPGPPPKADSARQSAEGSLPPSEILGFCFGQKAGAAQLWLRRKNCLGTLESRAAVALTPEKLREMKT